MTYLKFAGLSLVAAILFLLCGAIFARSFFGDVGGYLGLGLALAITGAGFARVKPAHFKFGYAVWIAVSAISLVVAQWAGAEAVRVAIEKGRPYAGFASFNYDLSWLAGCVLSNPVCYWLGKRLAYRLMRGKRISALAEQFD
jgi:hypothetical protein